MKPRQTQRQPCACRNMGDIRHEIDHLDRQLIALLGERRRYVKAAAPFKQDPDAVRAKERFNSMLLQRRQWAREQELSADVIEQLYRTLITYFIDEEMADWQAHHAPATSA